MKTLSVTIKTTTIKDLLFKIKQGLHWQATFWTIPSEKWFKKKKLEEATQTQCDLQSLVYLLFRFANLPILDKTDFK